MDIHFQGNVMEKKTISARLRPFRVAGDGYSGGHRQDFVRDLCRRNECHVRVLQWIRFLI